MDKTLTGLEIRGPKEIKISSSVTEISSCNFVDCEDLIHVSIPNTVTKIGYGAFWGCSNLLRAIVPNSVVSIDDQAWRGCSSLNTVKLPDTLTVIEDGTFLDCTVLKKINIPEDLNTIGEKAFANCRLLPNIEFPMVLKYIGIGAFANCNSFTEVEIGHTIEQLNKDCFSSCLKLKAVNIWSTKLTEIPFGAFQNCINLKVTRISSPITHIDKAAFQGCENLTEVYLPESLAGGVIDAAAFANCVSLRKIVFAGTRSQWDSITKVEPEDESQHWDYRVPWDIVVICKGDLTVWKYESGNEFSENIRGELSYHASLANDKITSVTIGDSITTITGRAFMNFYHLESISFSKYLKEIQWFAFYNCHNFNTIYYSGTYDDWNQIDLHSCPSEVSPEVIYEEWKEGAAQSTGEITVKFIDNSHEDLHISTTDYYVVCQDEDENVLSVKKFINAKAAIYEEPQSIEGYTYSTTIKHADRPAMVFIYTKDKKDKEQIYEEDSKKVKLEYLTSCDDVDLGLTDVQKEIVNKLLNNYIVELDDYAHEYKFFLVKDNTVEPPTYSLKCKYIKRINVSSIDIFEEKGTKVYSYRKVVENNTVGDGDNIQVVDCLEYAEYKWKMNDINVSVNDKTFVFDNLEVWQEMLIEDKFVKFYLNKK